MDKKFRNVISKAKSILFLTTVLVASQMSNVYAAAQPKLVSGAVKLAQDILVWTLILLPVVAAAAIGYQALMKMLNDDPAAVAARNKNMKRILIAGAIGESASAIVTAVLAYFT